MNLKEIRKNIDRLDFRILKLLNDRMELALMTKRFKSQVEHSRREQEVLQKIRQNSKGLINSDFIENIYKEIMKESKNLQKRDYALIAFQGEHGGFGEVAAREWDHRLVPVPCRDFSEIFEGVASGPYSYGIVPVENRLGGVFAQVSQRLIQSELMVVGAVELPLHLSLMVPPGMDYREIRTVYSHSHALEQCRRFLERNKLEPVPYYDAAGAAKMLAEQPPKAAAAIASTLSAEFYNLEIIKEDIEDSAGNVTRYLVLSGEEMGDEGDKCSVLFSTEHKAGTLFKVLEVFAGAHINLTRIESVSTEQGNYMFFLDFMGSRNDEKIIRTLEEVKGITTRFRLMGFYRENKVD
ncbi:MAG: chorismate mutase [Deltaproteobacteria bacterium]|nr:chorismate mutase [Deltaproteobacteria bacterium]